MGKEKTQGLVKNKGGNSLTSPNNNPGACIRQLRVTVLCWDITIAKLGQAFVNLNGVSGHVCIQLRGDPTWLAVDHRGQWFNSSKIDTWRALRGLLKYPNIILHQFFVKTNASLKKKCRLIMQNNSDFFDRLYSIVARATFYRQWFRVTSDTRLFKACHGLLLGVHEHVNNRRLMTNRIWCWSV